MDGFDRTAERGADGRFQPGQGEAEALTRLIVEKALAGDGVAARFLLGRLFAKPRGPAIRLQLPKGARPGDVVAAFSATLAAMAAGEITPKEALTVTRVLEGRVRALEAWRLERKLTSNLGPVPGDAVVAEDASAEEEERLLPSRENALPSSHENPLPFTGEGRVRANSERSQSSECAAIAPIPSPPPSPVNGRGSYGGVSGRGSDGGDADRLHFACNDAEGEADGAGSPAASIAAQAPASPPRPLHFACNSPGTVRLEREMLRRMVRRAVMGAEAGAAPQRGEAVAER